MGEYYEGIDFDRLVAVRQEKQIYFDWDYKPPIEELNAEYFSIRWRGKVYAEKEGKYVLTAMTDDGMRIWLNGRLILNAWVDQRPMTYEKRLFLEADAFYDIRIDYYQKRYQTTAAVFLNHVDDEKTPLSDINTVFGRDLSPSKARFDFWEEESLINQFYNWIGLREEVLQAMDDQSFRPVPQKKTVVPEMSEKNAKGIKMPESVVSDHEAIEELIETRELPNRAEVNQDIKEQQNPYEALKPGDTLRIRNIYFDRGRAKLRPESIPELNKLYQALAHHPEWKIKINGHTDNLGYAALNLELSYDRARAVFNYLIGKGIEKGRLKFEGFGSSQPVSANDCEENRQLNRRVEVTLIESELTTNY